MASFTVHQPGTAEEVTELRARLMEFGSAIGYGALRGEHAGRGAIGNMLRDIGEGRAAVFPQGQPGDFAWLAGALEELVAAHPLRVELLRSAIAACGAAERLAARGPIFTSGRERGGRYELGDGG